jgi:ubiquinone/menaquinone biosynthesis C-methylase UbiE
VDHADHTRLLRDGVPRGGTWADLGSGTGAFTLALAELVGPQGEVIAVDRDRGALRELERSVRPGGAAVRMLAADFTRPLDLASLDGIVMANSLHCVRDKTPVLALVRGRLKPSGRLLLVEYDTDIGNQWVPHPLSFKTWRALADRSGFSGTRKLASVGSRFLDRIFSAESIKV